MKAILTMAALASTVLSGVALAGEPVTVTREGLNGPLAGMLAGELSAEVPAVLIVPGSGPTDRDGNNPLGVTASSYRLLAEALAERGIASVRIDKRGMFESAGAVADVNDVTVEDYAGDIAAWSGEMLARSGGTCVWLLGHSEGGIHIMSAATADPSRYCGLLLVASPGRNLADVIREQLASNPANAPLMPQVDSILTRLRSGERVPQKDIHPGLMPLFAPAVQKLVISLFAQDTAAMLQAHDLPVLVLGGREDFQTPDADAAALAAARADIRLVLLEGVNHVLKEVPVGDNSANFASYSNPDLPIAPGVVEAIADFVTAAR